MLCIVREIKVVVLEVGSWLVRCLIILEVSVCYVEWSVVSVGCF